MGQQVLPPTKVLDLPLPPSSASLDKALKKTLAPFKKELVLRKKIEVLIEKRAAVELDIIDLAAGIQATMANIESVKNEFSEYVKYVLEELLASPQFVKLSDQFAGLLYAPKDVQLKLRMAAEQTLSTVCAPAKATAEAKVAELTHEIVRLRDKIQELEAEHAAITAEISGYQEKLTQ